MKGIVVEDGTANLKAQAFLGCVRGSILDGESANYPCVRFVQSSQPDRTSTVANRISESRLKRQNQFRIAGDTGPRIIIAQRSTQFAISLRIANQEHFNL